MSVYTPISPSQLQNLLADYPFVQAGQVTGFEAISNGIENTNYRLHTPRGSYILTIYEQLQADELPWYFQLLDSLRQHNMPVPQIVYDRHGRRTVNFKGKPAAVFKHLEGQHIERPSLDQCRQIGIFLGQFHSFSRTYPDFKVNTWSLQEIHSKAQQLSNLGCLSTGDQQLLYQELNWQQQFCHAELPHGIIHADLFRDNALFKNQLLSGVLDFYTACHGSLLFDLAVVVNDWCTEQDNHLNPRKVQALIQAYQGQRPLEAIERQQWPAMLRFALLRFWVSRLVHRWQVKQNPNKKCTDLIQDKDPDVLKYLLRNYRDKPSLHQLVEPNAF